MRSFGFDRLDRYNLRLLAGPLAVSLATLLVAQLLERLLRLFDLVVSAGAPPSSVVLMAANLVPHYLGLALPMAFTAALFMVAARLGDDNELDVMLTAGRSIVRVALPFFLLAVMLSLFNLYLFGELQPVTRYGYQAAVNRAIQTGWDARVRENGFVEAGPGLTFSANAIDADGRGMRGVFIEKRRGGAEEVTTAARGQLSRAPDGRGLVLRLEDGVMLRDDHESGVSISRFERGTYVEMPAPRPPFRGRGDSVRERTFPELWRDLREEGSGRAAAEFHSRLARALVMPLLPLLALPLGMASKRGRRTPGIVFAALALLALDHALQFGESLAKAGHMAAAPAVWTPFAVFALLSVWIFRGSLAWPGDNAVSRAVLSLHRMWERWRPRRRGAIAP